MSFRTAFAFASGLLLAAASLPAAACTFNEVGGSLGTVSSFRVRSGLAVTSSARFEFNCTGVVLAVLTGQPSVRATIAGPVTNLTLKNGTDTIAYSVTGTAQAPYTNGQVVINVNGTTAVGLLTGSNARVPVNITTAVGANIPAGTYTDTLPVLWSYRNICEGLINVAGLCLGVVSNGDITRTMTISLTVTNDCSITAPDIPFGSAPLPLAFPAVSNSIGLLCTRGLDYTVGLSAGNNPSGGRRQMASGANRLQYDIFKADNTVWGSTGTARAARPALADGLNQQFIPYTARIYTSQPSPPIGVYGDSVVVDVGF